MVVFGWNLYFVFDLFMDKNDFGFLMELIKENVGQTFWGGGGRGQEMSEKVKQVTNEVYCIDDLQKWQNS